MKTKEIFHDDDALPAIQSPGLKKKFWNGSNHEKSDLARNRDQRQSIMQIESKDHQNNIKEELDMEPKIINIDNIKEKLRIEPRINYSDLLITIFAFDLSSEDKIESLL